MLFCVYQSLNLSEYKRTEKSLSWGFQSFKDKQFVSLLNEKSSSLVANHLNCLTLFVTVETPTKPAAFHEPELA